VSAIHEREQEVDQLTLAHLTDTGSAEVGEHGLENRNGEAVEVLTVGHDVSLDSVLLGC